MLKLYWRILFRPYLWRISLIAFITFLSSIADVGSIGLTMPLADLLLNPDGGATNPANESLRKVAGLFNISPQPESLVLIGLGAILCLITLKNILKLLGDGLVGLLMNEVSNTYRRRMLSAYLCVQYPEIMRRGRGMIYQDIEGVSDGIRSAVVQGASLLYTVLYAIAMMTLLLYISWWLTIIIGIVVFFGARQLRVILETRVRDIGSRLHNLDQKVARFLMDILDGVRIVKANAIESFVTERLVPLQDQRLRLGVRYRLFSNTPAALFEIVAVLMIASLMFVAFKYPNLGFTLPGLLVMIITLNRLLSTIGNINNNFVALDSIRRKIETADEVLNILPREISGGLLLTDKSVEEIQMKGISFHYPERAEVRILHDIEILFRRGQSTALVGKTGAGKTTVVDLLMRLYEPTSGSIWVDGVDLREIDLTAWRSSIGYVGQDTYLFNTTLRENIILWDETIDKAAFEDACQASQIHDFVKTFPDGYETEVGDRGLKLSGGQRQRIAIARAILRRPRILIFDEATSALDNITEKTVNSAIAQLRATSIVIHIAHRLSTVQDADQIIVLREGCVVEQGTYDGLLEQHGYFWQLYSGDSNENS